MGQWAITITGSGPHHNNKDYDIERKTEAFVIDLARGFHNIKSAEVTIGSSIGFIPTGPANKPQILESVVFSSDDVGELDGELINSLTSH